MAPPQYLVFALSAPIRINAVFLIFPISAKLKSSIEQHRMSMVMQGILFALNN